MLSPVPVCHILIFTHFSYSLRPSDIQHKDSSLCCQTTACTTCHSHATAVTLTNNNTAGAHQPDLLLERNTSSWLLHSGTILGRSRRAAALSWAVRHLIRWTILFRFKCLFYALGVARALGVLERKRLPCASSLCVQETCPAYLIKDVYRCCFQQLDEFVRLRKKNLYIKKHKVSKNVKCFLETVCKKK